MKNEGSVLKQNKFNLVCNLKQDDKIHIWFVYCNANSIMVISEAEHHKPKHKTQECGWLTTFGVHFIFGWSVFKTALTIKSLVSDY